MSVKRKGPRATFVRVVTYVMLVAVAVIVAFPFIVALSTSTKNSQDIFSYPPSLIPQEAATAPAEDYGLEGDPVSLFDFDGTSFALAENNVPIAEYTPLDDPDMVIRQEAGLAVETDRTTVIDGDDETVYIVTVDGDEVEAWRSRITSGGRFVSADGAEVIELINLAEPVERFGPRMENFTEVIDDKELGRALTNTVLVTILVVVGQLLTSILGGYAFARIRFVGRDKLFLLYLGSVMVPFVVLIIPLFQIMLQAGWLDSLAALIIPFTFTVYGTFLMRQFFVGIPMEIEEAALIDGATRWRILWKVMVPLARPAIATLATFGFLYAWNSFFWPLVIINSANADSRVLSLALATLGGRSATDINLVFAGAIIAMTPPILVFLFAQRYFVENSASSGLK